MTNQGARNLVRDAARRGWLIQVAGTGRGTTVYWLAQEIWHIRESVSSS